MIRRYHKVIHAGKFLMKGCSAQDGDLEWSDSCIWLLPAHPCRFEINSHPTSSKNTVTRAGNSSSWPSINPNTLRFLLLSCSAATILSPSSTFYCCRLYHLHCSFAVLLHCSSVSLTRLHRGLHCLSTATLVPTFFGHKNNQYQ